MKAKITIVVWIVLLSLNVKAQNFLGSWSEPLIPSPSLSNSILSPVDSLKIGVYLPESYSNSNKTYPVIYFLQGYYMPVNSWICTAFDALLKEKKVDEAIFVLISGVHATKGSFYVNSPVLGNWADFVTKDVIEYVDKCYRTIPQKESRALVGYSMGGYGALNLGLSNTQLYHIVYSISPGLFAPNGLKTSQMYNNPEIVKNTFTLYDKISSLPKKKAHTACVQYLDSVNTFNDLELTVAYGMAFSPNTDRAPYFNYPYTVNGSDTICKMQIWNDWYNGFGGIANVIDRNLDHIKQLKLLGLNCGYNDHNHWIVQGTNYYSQLLLQRGIPYKIVWHQGNHHNQLLHQLKNDVLPDVISELKKFIPYNN